jgi:hypothetical protein
MFRDGKIDRAGGLNRNRCIRRHICAVGLERASLTAQWPIGSVEARPQPARWMDGRPIFTLVKFYSARGFRVGRRLQKARPCVIGGDDRKGAPGHFERQVRSGPGMEVGTILR